ncbi:uncharacterized protein LOC127376033 isoform X2 [Dicentrarchus labrax]|uniref:uncharacterized protein LOC127376033 isoform X2 n=1 Tax=Dicentrarchus labrax TaxID=13489 RepID=UPI0021F67BBD|nr:uncharacterized protein LOC127376033 isoform X2 [Dicentrarchus labrax]
MPKLLAYRQLGDKADDFGEKEEVWIAETGTTSRLSTRLDESARPASRASSSASSTTVAKMFVSRVIDLSVKTLQSTVAVSGHTSLSGWRILQCHCCYQKTGKPRRLWPIKSFLTEQHTAIKRGIQTEKGLNDSKKMRHQWEDVKKGARIVEEVFQWMARKKIHLAPLTDLDEAVRSGSIDLTLSTGESKPGSSCSQETSSTASSTAAVGADLRSTRLELANCTEKEDKTPEDIKIDVPSLSSTSSFPEDDQII